MEFWTALVLLAGLGVLVLFFRWKSSLDERSSTKNLIGPNQPSGTKEHVETSAARSVETSAARSVETSAARSVETSAARSAPTVETLTAPGPAPDASSEDIESGSAPTEAASPQLSASKLEVAPEHAPSTEEGTSTANATTEEEVRALRKGLSATRGGFVARLAKLFSKRDELAPALLDEIEEVLITADVGVQTTQSILEQLKNKVASGELKHHEEIWDAIRVEAAKILETSEKASSSENKPKIILVIGVNGAGKTTTIGKLASQFSDRGQDVILAAGDTFRAAAVLQLDVWGRRVGCTVVKGKDRADPSAVIYEAIKQGIERQADVVIADTAGRLHTKDNLMEELKKVLRSSEKAAGRPVDEIFLVLDSTTGQNAIRQAELFKQALPVSGIVLTKLDGTAKGGVILGIVETHKIPVRYIGIGERIEDLKAFQTESFVDALFQSPEDTGAQD
ncbi:MAG: signal recognition particle-docking protein FtsY [Myxococcota bacterium]